jgi:hypothetical protein
MLKIICQCDVKLYDVTDKNKKQQFLMSQQTLSLAAICIGPAVI